MKVIFLSAALSFIAFSSSAADKITGFAQFEFGMSIDATSKLTNLSEGKAQKAEEFDTWHDKSGTIDVLGQSYNIGLGFKDNRLEGVNISRSYDTTSVACGYDFESVYGPMKAKYGNPDSPVEKESTEIYTMWSAKFTGTDASKVILSANSLGTLCFINVAYRAGRTGNTF
jgi:hypothetical protein